MAGETINDIILAVDGLAQLAGHTVMLHGPHDLADGIGGVIAVAGDGIKPVIAHGFGQLFYLRRSSLVCPDDGGAEQFAFLIQQHGTHHMAGEADAHDLCGIDGRSQFFRHTADGGIPILGILLRPIAVGVVAGVAFHKTGDQLALGGKQGGLIAGRAQIVGQNILHQISSFIFGTIITGFPAQINQGGRLHKNPNLSAKPTPYLFTIHSYLLPKKKTAVWRFFS